MKTKSKKLQPKRSKTQKELRIKLVNKLRKQLYDSGVKIVHIRSEKQVIMASVHNRTLDEHDLMILAPDFDFSGEDFPATLRKLSEALTESSYSFDSPSLHTEARMWLRQLVRGIAQKQFHQKLDELIQKQREIACQIDDLNYAARSWIP